MAQSQCEVMMIFCINTLQESKKTVDMNKYNGFDNTHQQQKAVGKQDTNKIHLLFI